MKLNEEKVISQLKQHNTNTLADIFNAFESAFVNWVVKDFDVDREQARDIFAESVIDFYENVTSGSYQKRKGVALKTYIFDIGKYKLLNINKRQEIHKARESEIIQKTEDAAIINPELLQRSSENVKIVQELFDKLCEQCREILRLFYYHNASMNYIAHSLGFANTDVAKSEKYQCLQQLKAIAKKKYKKADFF